MTSTRMYHREICDYIDSLRLFSLKKKRKDLENLLAWLLLLQIFV